MSRSVFLKQLDTVVWKSQALRWSDALCVLLTVGAVGVLAVFGIGVFLPEWKTTLFRFLGIALSLYGCWCCGPLILRPLGRRGVVQQLVVALPTDCDADRFLRAAVDFEENPETTAEPLRRKTVESACELLHRIPDSFFRWSERLRRIRNTAITLAITAGILFSNSMFGEVKKEQLSFPVASAEPILSDPASEAAAVAVVKERLQADRLTESLKKVYRRTRGELVRTLGVPFSSLSLEQRTILSQLADEQSRIAARFQEQPDYAVDATLLHEAEGALKENRLGFAMQRQALVLRRHGVDLQGLSPLREPLHVAGMTDSDQSGSNRSSESTADETEMLEPVQPEPDQGILAASTEFGGEQRETDATSSGGRADVDPTRKQSNEPQAIALDSPSATTLRRIWGELLPQHDATKSAQADQVLPAYREKTERYLRSLLTREQ